MNKKFLRFRYAAIKRYGDKYWTAHADYIEFNSNYTVSCEGALPQKYRENAEDGNAFRLMTTHLD